MQRLVRLLVDKEKPIWDMVKDYTFGGQRITDSYERERQGAFELNKAQADRTRLEFSAIFDEAEAAIMEVAIRYNRPGKDAFRSQWLAQRQSLMENAKRESARYAKEG